MVKTGKIQKSAQANTTEKKQKPEQLYMLSNMQTKMCAVPLNAREPSYSWGLGGCVRFVRDGFLSKAFAIETNLWPMM